MGSPEAAPGFASRVGKMNAKQTLVEINQMLKSGNSIPAARLDEWLASDDLEVLGACHEILTERFDRLDAKAKTRFAVPSEHVCSRMLHFLRRCFVENRPGEFALNRYQAGRSLYNWFLVLSNLEPVPREALDEIKSMLGELYRSGDAELRHCIVTSCLEHLFESRRIAKYFADWQNDPGLATAYAEALEWGRHFWPGQRGY